LEGELDAGTVTFGQVVGMVKHIPTVREVIDDMVEGATQIRAHLLKQIASPVSSRSPSKPLEDPVKNCAHDAFQRTRA